MPPFQSVDEASHFYRGYEVASGNFIPKKINDKTGDYLPSSLEKLATKYSFLIKNIDNKIHYNYIIESFKIKLNPKTTHFIDFKNTALYSPITYLTQVPGMIIAKSFDANPLTIFYFGRISNLIFFSLIIYFSIKIIPFYKIPLMLLALMPMTLSLAAALTSDVVVIGINFLWTALLLKFIYEKTKPNIVQILSLTVLSIILVLSKHYFMLIPLIFLLPAITPFSKSFSYRINLRPVESLLKPILLDSNSRVKLFYISAKCFSHPLSYISRMEEELQVTKRRRIFTIDHAP